MIKREISYLLAAVLGVSVGTGVGTGVASYQRDAMPEQVLVRDAVGPAWPRNASHMARQRRTRPVDAWREDIPLQAPQRAEISQVQLVPGPALGADGNRL